MSWSLGDGPLNCDGFSHAIGTSQGFPGAFSAAWSFVAPEDGPFHFFMTAVDAHLYPLTDAADICIKESSADPDAACIVRTTVDQRAGIRDGRWQRVASAVDLRSSVEYVDLT